MKKALIVSSVGIILILGIGTAYYQIRWSPQQEISKIRSEIDTTVRTEAVSVSSCKVAPIGHRACGGPDGYIVYSEETTDVSKLQRLNSQYYSLVVKSEKKNGGGSICILEMPPGVVLENGHCVATSNIVF